MKQALTTSIMKKIISAIVFTMCAIIVVACSHSPEEYYNEGVLYLTGDGVTQNLDKAEKLLTKAAKKEYVPAYRGLGRVYMRKGYTEEGLKWYDKAALCGDKIAARMLGDAYYNGAEGIEQNNTKAQYYYEKALEIGEDKDDATVHSNLGYLYASSEKPEIDKAISHYTRAIELDESNSGAYFDLGQIYYWGLGGIKKDYKKAIQYYKQAADLNNPTALWNLAVCYDNGLGVKKNHNLCVNYAKKAADLGLQEAQDYLEQLRQEEERKRARDNQLVLCYVCHGRGITQGTGFHAGSIVTCGTCGGTGYVRRGEAESLAELRNSIWDAVMSSYE